MAALERHVRGYGGYVLDVGCGNGLLFPVLQHYGQVEGIEADPRLVDECERADGTIHVGRFDERFRPGKTYRLIVMLDVLEHLPDAQSALRHALSLLDEDGTLLITVPAFRLLWTGHDELNGHYTRYTRSSFRQLAEACDLRIDILRYFYHWLFPLKLAVRAQEACLRRSPRPPRIPGPMASRLCYGISRLEQRLGRRWSIPFGSSLLAVGGHHGAAVPAEFPCADTTLAYASDS